jgi:hypothetical protein
MIEVSKIEVLYLDIATVQDLRLPSKKATWTFRHNPLGLFGLILWPDYCQILFSTAAQQGNCDGHVQ